MEFHGLLGMRRTIHSFDNVAVEVYFLNFSKSVVAYVPEYAICFAAWGEHQAMDGLVALMRNLGMVKPEAEIKEIEVNERSGARKVPKAGRHDPEPGLF